MNFTRYNLAEELIKFNDQQLINELRNRKRLRSINAEFLIPNMYVSELSKGRGEQEAAERLSPLITEMILNGQVKMTKTTSYQRFDERTSFLVSLEVVCLR